MKFKERGNKLQDEREEVEDIINKGIKIYNETMKDNIEIIESIHSMCYYNPHTHYIFQEDGIKIIWFEDTGTCGETDIEKLSKLIPYEYFDFTEDEKEKQNKIEENKKLKNILLKKIKDKEKEIDEAQKTIRDISQEKRALASIMNKYGKGWGTSAADDKIEREIKKNKGLLIILEDELREYKEDLKNGKFDKSN